MLLGMKQVNDKCCSECCRAWAARRAERFGLASIFGSTFCIKAKGGITNTSMCVEEKKDYYSNASPGSA
jgi:hypothetical protein